MNIETKTRNCPLCKEEIHPEAVKCKHCGSSIAPEKPAHEGTCPYCKEEIHPEAIKCKHCKSSLVASMAETDCGSQETPFRTAMARLKDGGWYPDPVYRKCQNDCTLEFTKCMTDKIYTKSRKECLELLSDCSEFCRTGSIGSFLWGGGVII